MDSLETQFHDHFSYESPVLYLPIRHHSPACAYQVTQVIGEYNPEILLIEGAQDTNHLIKHLGDEQNTPPFAIYYSYNDKAGILSDEAEKYACYYPFLAYSPELAAIRESVRRSIPVSFIDLPYTDLLQVTAGGKGFRQKKEKHDYSDDEALDYSSFITALCEKEGCRDSEELWEKHFELPGFSQSAKQFFSHLFSYCHFSRLSTEQERMESDGTFARESYMRQQIEDACGKYQRVLVITGGFHTPALIVPPKSEKKLKCKTVKDEDKGTYLMAYSFDAASRLRGYASGMKYPAFYQKVWEHAKGDRFSEALCHFLLVTQKACRKRDIAVSLPDLIESFRMAEGLCQLREKNGTGAYELLDAVQTCFVKGELDMAEEFISHILKRQLIGDRIGSIGTSTEVPPLVQDFQRGAKQHKTAESINEKEIAISPYKSDVQRAKSCFFHQMAYLTESFCKLQKGPDFILQKNKNLMTETWVYRWSPALITELIEKSQFGSTLPEAAGELLLEEYKNEGHHSSGKTAKLIVKASIMGLSKQADTMIALLHKTITEDGQFQSAALCSLTIDSIVEAGDLLRLSNQHELIDIVNHALVRAITLLPSLASIAEDVEDEIINHLKDLYFLIVRRRDDEYTTLFIDALRALCDHKQINAAVEGAALGILVGLGAEQRSAASDQAQLYLSGSGNSSLLASAYLKGLFSTAKETLLCSQALIKSLDSLIAEIPEEDFMAIVPNMRLAFSFFTPAELNTVGGHVAEFYNLTKEEIINRHYIDSAVLQYARIMEEKTVARLRKRGIQC